MDKLLYAPLFVLAMAFPSLKQSGLYVEGDPQVFSIVTSDEKRTNYRLTAKHPEGVVIIKSKTSDSEEEEGSMSNKEGKQINLYATINTDRFNEIIDPSVVDEQSLNESRIVSISDVSLLAVMKVLAKRPEYSKLDNPFRSDASTQDISQIVSFISKANQIREGLVDVEDEESAKIETFINSNKFKNEIKTSMKELKVQGCLVTSQKMRDKFTNFFRSEPAVKTPRFMSR